jgi:hypothetical protein
MAEVPTLAELQSRIRQSVAYYGGSLPKDAALVWDGYFAALLEWGLISISDHETLVSLLPEVPDNPVIRVLLGWEKSGEGRA